MKTIRVLQDAGSLAAHFAIVSVVMTFITGVGPACAASFDDVQFWVGEGDNRAALVLDWSKRPESAQSLVWGFRFDDEATGSDMLQAVLAADARFYAKINRKEVFGLVVYGFGYDWNGDEQFQISDDTLFDADGVADLVPAAVEDEDGSPVDGASAADPLDVYHEGWFFSGFWNYATAPSDPFSTETQWTTSITGPSSRVLVDGDWDAWTFAPSYDSALPDAPISAPAPSIPGDYDRDLNVDGSDLMLLQREYGSSANPYGASADGNVNGAIDGEDFAVWSEHFGERAAIGNSVVTTSTVPEPATWLLALGLLSRYVMLAVLRFLNSLKCKQQA